MMKLFYKNQRLSLCILLLLPSLPAWSSEPSSGFLNWYPRAELSSEEVESLPSFCHGSYRIADIPMLDNERIETEADESSLSRNGEATFKGNVQLQQLDRVMYSDSASWNQNTMSGQLQGNVSLTSPLLVLYGDSAKMDNQQGAAEFYQAQYSLPASHMRGSAAYIKAQNSGHMQLKSATMTFCEPGHNDWDIAASTLKLDRDKGRGSAWNTRLRVMEVPVFYFPYYYFPIDDRRLTGFLDPSISLSSKLQGEDIQLPFYLNLAPNMDATITPHQVREHGLIWETQFRHLTSLFGEGEANYAVLNKDETTDTKRWFLNYQQQGKFGQNWQHRWVYNQVSDKDFFNDANPTEATNRSTHLPRRGEILWNKSHWHFDVTAEEFQTIDDSIALRSRPYARLPQLNLSYLPVKFNQLQLQQRLQATRFTRADSLTLNGIETTLDGFASLNGDRLVSDTSLSYPLEWPFGFLTPKVEYRVRSYALRDLQLTAAQAANPALYDLPADNITISTPRYSLDGGLYFERDFSWFNSSYQQTFEPRIYWVNSPLVDDQHKIPNFDSAELTVTYSSLFFGDRFTGDDRLADMNQVTLGATTRFIRDDGLEQFRFSLGQIFYLRDREVQLNGGIFPLPDPNAPPPAPSTVPSYNKDLNNNSSFMAEAEWNPTTHWSWQSSIEWDPYKNFARQSRHGIRFEDGHNHMFNLAYNEARDWSYNGLLKKEETRPTTAQVDAGVFWSFNDRWAVFGRALVDVNEYRKADAALGTTNENKPYHPVLESIAGFEYQNCCWRFQLSYRETSLQNTNAIPTPKPEQWYTTEKNYSFMFSIQLKGLGTFGKKTDSLISEAIPGYSRRIYHDF